MVEVLDEPLVGKMSPLNMYIILFAIWDSQYNTLSNPICNRVEDRASSRHLISNYVQKHPYTIARTCPGVQKGTATYTQDHNLEGLFNPGIPFGNLWWHW